MKSIKMLDCTLRDGGYCNEWKFGYENTKEIIKKLVESGLEIIECGFLTNKLTYDANVTQFTNLEQVSRVLPKNKNDEIIRDSKYVVMMNYGEYDPDTLPQNEGKSIDGIRLAFHKKNLDDAVELARIIKKKGYQLFIQAMVSLNYNDDEFLDLIRKCNELMPTAFYIVDSFGVMKQKDLTRLYYLVENNLNDGIMIGYHSHNNLQLSYSNAQALTQIPSNRDLVIDSSIYGMGRGAGNLNTELFLGFLNDYHGKNYNIKPILYVIDTVIDKFHQENYWDIHCPNYLSATHNAHPNYAKYFAEKNTLTIDNMDDLFSMMPADMRNHYDESQAEKLFQGYMSRDEVFYKNKQDFEERLKGREILIIAPGKSVAIELDKVKACIDELNPLIFAVNYKPSNLDADYLFVSNFRRFRDLSENVREKMIVTSNIRVDGIYLEVPYSELTNEIVAVRDNAGLMLINFLKKEGAKKVYIAGMDGYDYDSNNNFADENMAFVARKAIFESMNDGMQQVLKQYADEVDLEFITSSRFNVRKEVI